jgi:hypothetical protein
MQVREVVAQWVVEQSRDGRKSCLCSAWQMDGTGCCTGARSNMWRAIA